MDTLPNVLRDHMIDYKGYKKLIKTSGTMAVLLEKLAQDANRVDKFFTRITKRSLFTSYVERPHKEDVYKYITLNSRTIYKICKRASKRMHDRAAMEWLRNLHNSRALSFMNGIAKKALELSISEEKCIECPICLENVKGEVIIMHCGHTLCLDCVKGVLKVANVKGTIYNLIAYGRYSLAPSASCPLCRDDKAFAYFKMIHI